LYGNEALFGLFAETDHGVERGVAMKVGIVRGKLDDVAELVVDAGEGAEEAEGDGPVGDELQGIVVDLDGGAFLGAAGYQAYGGELAVPRFAEGDVVGAGQSAAHENTAARRSGVGVVGGASGDGKVEVDVLEDLGPAAVPLSHDVGDALAQDL